MFESRPRDLKTPPLRRAVDAVLDAQAGVNRCHAAQLRGLYAVSKARTTDDEFTADIVGAELRWSRRTAQESVALAEALVEFLPLVLEAMETGALCLDRAKVFSSTLLGLDEDDLERIYRQELPEAPFRTLGQLRARLEREVLAINPDAAEERHKRAKKNRDLQLNPQHDGMATLEASMAADDATACFERITQLVEQQAPRGRAQHR